MNIADKIYKVKFYYANITTIIIGVLLVLFAGCSDVEVSMENISEHIPVTLADEITIGPPFMDRDGVVNWGYEGLLIIHSLLTSFADRKSVV